MDAAALAEYVTQTRVLTALGECPRHPGSPPVDCGSCRGDRLAARDGSEDHWRILHAMAACDRLFPRRFRDATAEHDAIVAWAERVIADPESAPSLLLLGTVGTGKTHQAYGALRSVLASRPQSTWAAAPFADFAAALRPRTGLDQEAEMERYRDAELLILDDLGAAKNSEWVEEITYRLVNGRYEAMRPTIYTTNRSPEELRATVGDRIASRLAETCTRVVLEGGDRRRLARAA